jgi:hypothetical protein
VLAFIKLLYEADRVYEVLPSNPKPWWRTNHLLALNCLLIIPFFSQASVGFDGESLKVLIVFSALLIIRRLDDERSPVFATMERIL